MIRTLMVDAEGRTMAGGEELIARWRESPDARLWSDMQGEPVAREREMLEAFDCHPMAIDDAHRERHPPKIDLSSGSS